MQGTILYSVHERMQPKKPWVGELGVVSKLVNIIVQ
jgi:hypothetical protein